MRPFIPFSHPVFIRDTREDAPMPVRAVGDVATAFELFWEWPRFGDNWETTANVLAETVHGRGRPAKAAHAFASTAQDHGLYVEPHKVVLGVEVPSPPQSQWPHPLVVQEQGRRMLLHELDLLPRNGVFLDLGANVGMVTREALAYGHFVYAFDPDPACLTALYLKFAANPSVRIIPKAVGNSARTARFYRRPDEDTEWSSLIKHGVHEGGQVLDVEVIDIVDFIKSLDRPVTMLKMDIEGAEAECLDAVLDAGLHRSIGKILVETHERFSDELAAHIGRIRSRIEREGITNINLEWI